MQGLCTATACFWKCLGSREHLDSMGHTKHMQRGIIACIEQRGGYNKGPFFFLSDAY